MKLIGDLIGPFECVSLVIWSELRITDVMGLLRDVLDGTLRGRIRNRWCVPSRAVMRVEAAAVVVTVRSRSGRRGENHTYEAIAEMEGWRVVVK